MGEDLVFSVERLNTPDPSVSVQGPEVAGSSRESSCSHTVDPSSSVIDIKVEDDEEQGTGGEDEPLIQTVECRICQEEDSIKNLETPCACSGSLKFAHRACVQRWCNEKRDITCEICHQPYQPNYTAPPPTYPEDTTIDIGEDWMIGGTPLDLHDPRLLAMAAAERRLLESDYDEYADSSTSGAAFCRSAALILISLMLLRHALTIGDDDGDDDDVSTFSSLFLFWVAVFLLPCYVMAWAISVMQRRRQRQEAAALAAAEVAFMLQAGQRRGLQVRIAAVPTPPPVPVATNEPAVTAHSEPAQ